MDGSDLSSLSPLVCHQLVIVQSPLRSRRISPLRHNSLLCPLPSLLSSPRRVFPHSFRIVSLSLTHTCTLTHSHTYTRSLGLTYIPRFNCSRLSDCVVGLGILQYENCIVYTVTNLSLALFVLSSSCRPLSIVIGA